MKSLGMKVLVSPHVMSVMKKAVEDVEPAMKRGLMTGHDRRKCP